MSGERIWANSAAAALVLVAALLIFPSLDDRYLWDDEAETALLAKNVLRFGVPVAWDGTSLISQECGTDYDANYLWRQTPWLPIYITAGTFSLFGSSTFTARLPFALLGLLSVPSMYLLGRRLFGDRLIALVATGSLALSVPFILHVRQGRYYAVAIFAAIWALHFFFLLPTRRRLAATGLAAALAALFHTSNLLFLALVAGLMLGFFILRFDRAVAPWLVAALAAATVVSLPWLFGADMGEKGGSLFVRNSPWIFVANMAWYAGRTELYAFPALLLVAALGATAMVTGARVDLRSPRARTCVFLVAVAVVHIAIVALVPFVFFRYLITLLPIWALLQGWAVGWLAARSRVLAVAILLLALLPDRADLVRGRFSITLVKYLDEITHHIPGPVEAMVTHLRTAARPGDRVFISYGDLPLRFYTSFEIRGGQGCQSLAGWPAPDWVFFRYFFRFRPAVTGVERDEERTLQYLRTHVTLPRYKTFTLPVIDRIWENIPEPERHVFRVPGNWPPITVYEKARP
jgi:hypothetical protein